MVLLQPLNKPWFGYPMFLCIVTWRDSMTIHPRIVYIYPTVIIRHDIGWWAMNNHFASLIMIGVKAVMTFGIGSAMYSRVAHEMVCNIGHEYTYGVEVGCYLTHFILSLTHWGRVTHTHANIGSDIGLSPNRRQASIPTNAGILLIWPLGTNFTCLENGGHLVSASICSVMILVWYTLIYIISYIPFVL